MATSIRAIDNSSIHRITSGQVVIDLQTAVKELVENSLDAGATNIGHHFSLTLLECTLILDFATEVKFKEYGLKSVEVVDNGSGIAEEDYDSIGESIARPHALLSRLIFTSALNHHTSKLSSLSSLTTLTSFGFRGEALSSLCALCESVVVITATDNAGQKGVGMKLEMGRRGDVVKKSVAARQVGRSLPFPMSSYL
jgi:DNA mismatch repair protein PMS2